MTQVSAPVRPVEAATSRSPVVAVAICTYRRADGLTRALDGIAGQVFTTASAPSIYVVVVDNEGDPGIRSIVDTFARRSGIAAVYVAEPRRGISQARNRSLAAIPDDADFVAIIDDDEKPDPGWLNALIETQARTGAAVVCGPILPIFVSPPPAWIVAGGFFVHPRRPDRGEPALADGERIADARTGNVLIETRAIVNTGARFDDAFGLTGGEDALFFRHLSAGGAVMVWSTEAVVREWVPAARARFAYLMREYFRCGNVRATIERLEGASPASTLKKGLKKALAHGAGLLAALTGGRGRAQIYGQIFELANAAGRLCALFGLRYQHYR